MAPDVPPPHLIHNPVCRRGSAIELCGELQATQSPIPILCPVIGCWHGISIIVLSSVSIPICLAFAECNGYFPYQTALDCIHSNSKM